MYHQIYDILVEFIYGNPEALTVYEQLTCTQVSTFLAFLCVALPIFACLMVMRWFFR